MAVFSNLLYMLDRDVSVETIGVTKDVVTNCQTKENNYSWDLVCLLYTSDADDE